MTLGLAWGATPTWADGTIITVTPGIGSTIITQPSAITVTFETPIGHIDSATTLSVIGPDAKHYETQCPAVEDSTLSTTATLGTPGTYTVTWRIASTPNRPRALQGSYSFEWQPTSETKIAAGTSTGPFCGVVAASATAHESASTWSPRASSSSATGDSTQSGETPGSMDFSQTFLPWIAGAAMIVVIGSAAGTLIFARRRRGVLTDEDAAADDADKKTGKPDGADAD